MSDAKTENNLIDPVACLRQIADEIERGEYGTVLTSAVVLRSVCDGDDIAAVNVFASGSEHDLAHCALALSAGQQMLINFEMAGDR